MTTPTRWVALVGRLNHGQAEIADVVMEAYLLGVEEGTARGTGSTLEPEQPQPAPQDTPDPQAVPEATTADDRAALDRGHIAEVFIYCDTCTNEHRADYIAPTTAQRIATARQHLTTQGWHITPDYDLCPTCKPSTTINTAQGGADTIGSSQHATAIVERGPAESGDLSPAADRRVRVERAARQGLLIAIRFYVDDGWSVTSWLPEDLVDALERQLAAGWRPAGAGETPGTVEPDDAQPQPQDLVQLREHPAPTHPSATSSPQP